MAWEGVECLLSFSVVLWAAPADVDDGLDARAAAALSESVGQLVVPRVAVCGPHVAVEEGADDGESISRVFVFVEELVLAFVVERALEAF